MKRAIYSFIILFIVVVASSCNKKRTPQNCMENLKADCICTQEYNPVCGCNNITYGNACEAACHGITDYTPGECQ